MGLFKSLFGKPDEDPYAGLSAGALESMAKSAAWSAEMQAKIKAANAGGDLDEAKRLERELKEAAIKTGKIEKHVEEIRAQILEREDQIELLERALMQMK